MFHLHAIFKKYSRICKNSSIILEIQIFIYENFDLKFETISYSCFHFEAEGIEYFYEKN